jgi:hypothetical protein
MALMNKRYLVLLALVALMTGCVPVDSLNPLYTDKDVVFDESLLGEWVGPDANDTGTMKFIKAGKDAYVIVMTDNDGPNGEQKTTFYDAHLLSLSGQKFLDVQLQEWGASPASYALHVGGPKGEQRIDPPLLKIAESAYLEFTVEGRGPDLVAHLRNAHRFFKIKTDGNKLHLDWIDDDKLKEAVLKGTLRVDNTLISTGASEGRHSATNTKDIVLTASTIDLQKFITEQMNNDKVFTGHGDMKRRSN